MLELFEGLKQAESGEEPPGGPYLILSMDPERIFRPGGVLIRGETLDRYRALQRALALPGAVEDELHGDYVDGLLGSACVAAWTESPEEAVDWLDLQLQQPLKTFTVVEAVHGWAPEILKVGRCVIYRDLSLVPGLEPPGEPGSPRARFLEELTGSRVMVARVIAPDPQTARDRARSRFDETSALLALLSRRVIAVAREPQLTFSDDETLHLSFGVDHTAYKAVTTHLMQSGEIRPPDRYLCAVPRIPHVDRTDWERRTLGAAQWWWSAMTSSWSGEGLVAGIAVLDALFGYGRRDGGPVAQIERALTKLEVAVPGMSAPDTAAWATDLYERKRNRAAHDGRAHDAYGDLRRLRELGLDLVVWATSHLAPEHRPDEVPCHTWRDALTCRERAKGMSPPSGFHPLWSREGSGPY